MMKIASAMLMATVSAQDCKDDSACSTYTQTEYGETKSGCCGRCEVISIADDSKWGGFSNPWGGDEKVVPGASYQFCAKQAYMDEHLAKNPSGETNNYEDLGIFLKLADS